MIFVEAVTSRQRRWLITVAVADRHGDQARAMDLPERLAVLYRGGAECTRRSTPLELVALQRVGCDPGGTTKPPGRVRGRGDTRVSVRPRAVVDVSSTYASTLTRRRSPRVTLPSASSRKRIWQYAMNSDGVW